tara:strand:- start:4556 stop:5305 length:750 start_codon:yes stop_codon:yes gene_type:complete
MGIDMSKMREKATALENKGNKRSDFWRPQDGETTIRILPTADGDPFKEFWFHYNVGNNPGFLSPKKNFGESDPLDDFIRKLYSEGSEDSIKMAKQLSARQRFFSPVIVRGQEHEGVKVWGYGKMAYRELLNLVLNPDYGDITDVDNGTDLIITYGKPAGAQFPQTNITPRRRTSALMESKSDSENLMSSIPEIPTLFERKSAQEVQVMLDEFLLGEEDAESTSSETTKYESESKTEENSVDRAFQELLG